MVESAVRAILRRAGSRVFRVPLHALPWVRSIQENASRGAESIRAWLEVTDGSHPQGSVPGIAGPSGFDVVVPLIGLLNDGIPSRTESVLFLSENDIRVQAPSPPASVTTRAQHNVAVSERMLRHPERMAPALDRFLSPVARTEMLGYLGEVRLASILCQCRGSLCPDKSRHSKCRLHVASEVRESICRHVYHNWSVKTLCVALEVYSHSPSLLPLVVMSPHTPSAAATRIEPSTRGSAGGCEIAGGVDNTHDEVLLVHVSSAVASQTPFMSDSEFASYAAVSRRLLLLSNISTNSDASDSAIRCRSGLVRRTGAARSFLQGCRLRALICQDSDEVQQLLADSVKVALALGEFAAIPSVLSAFPVDEWFLSLMQAASTTARHDDSVRGSTTASATWRWGPVQLLCCGALALGARVSQVPLRRKLGEVLAAATMRTSPAATVDDELSWEAGEALVQVLVSSSAVDDGEAYRSHADRERRELLVQLRSGTSGRSAAEASVPNGMVDEVPNHGPDSASAVTTFRELVLRLRSDGQRGDLLRDAFRLVLRADTLSAAVAMVDVACRHYAFLCYCLWFRIVSVLLPEAMASETRNNVAEERRESDGDSVCEQPRAATGQNVTRMAVEAVKQVSLCVPLSEWLTTLLQAELGESHGSSALLREAARLALRASDASAIADLVTRLDLQFSMPLPLSTFRFLGLLIEVTAHEALTVSSANDEAMPVDEVHAIVSKCAARLQTGGCLRRHALVLSMTPHSRRLVQPELISSPAAAGEASVGSSSPPALRQPVASVRKDSQRALARVLFELTEYVGSSAVPHNVLRASMQSLRSADRLDVNARLDAMKPILARIVGAHHTRALVLLRATSRPWIRHVRRLHDAWRSCSSPWFDVITLLQHRFVGDGLARRTHRLLLAEHWLSSASVDVDLFVLGKSTTTTPNDADREPNLRTPTSDISATDQSDEMVVVSASSALERILGSGTETRPPDTAERLREVTELLKEFSQLCGLRDTATPQLMCPSAVLDWSPRGMLTTILCVTRFVVRLADIDRGRGGLVRQQTTGFGSPLHVLFAPAGTRGSEWLTDRQRGLQCASQRSLDEQTVSSVAHLPPCVADVVRYEQAVDRVLLSSHPADALAAYTLAASWRSLPPLAVHALRSANLGGRKSPVPRALLMPTEGHDRALFLMESTGLLWLHALETLSLWAPNQPEAAPLTTTTTTTDSGRASPQGHISVPTAYDDVLPSLLCAMSKQGASHLAVTFVRSGKEVPREVLARLRDHNAPF